MERRLLLFLVLASVLVAGNAMAANDLSHADTSVQGLLDLVLQQSHQWSGKLYYYAIRLFWLLATIQFVWTLMPLVMKQADFGEIVGELLRFVMVIGFFLAVMTYSVEWSTAIVDSFRDAAASASGLGRALEPGDMLAVALDFAPHHGGRHFSVFSGQGNSDRCMRCAGLGVLRLHRSVHVCDARRVLRDHQRICAVLWLWWFSMDAGLCNCAHAFYRRNRSQAVRLNADCRPDRTVG